MKIWFTEIGEPLPIEKNVRLHRYGNLTKLLARRGHDVTWWTSNFSHAPKAFVRAGDSVECVDGVNLRVLAGPGYRRNISFQRFKHQAHFARRFYQEAQKQPRPDILISPIPTLEAAEVAARFGLENVVPVLTDIRDEWPDEFVNVAPPPLRPLARLALHKSFARMNFICRNVSGIMAISKRQLAYGLSFANRPLRENDGVFPIGYDATPVEEAKLASALDFWRSKGIDGSCFTACMFATITPFFRIDVIIEAARILEREFPVRFVLCGEGRSLREMKKRAEDVKSVLFPGWVDQPKIAALMSLSSAGLAPYAANTAFALPNKPFEYFAGGLPVVTSIQTELRELLIEADCGLTYEAGSVQEFANAIRTLQASPERCREMGIRGRRLLEERFTTEILGQRIENHLQQVLQRNQTHT